jgi:transcription initiation factor IIE alpha subunit
MSVRKDKVLLACPTCGHYIETDTEIHGHNRCPNCGEVFEYASSVFEYDILSKEELIEHIKNGIEDLDKDKLIEIIKKIDKSKK